MKRHALKFDGDKFSITRDGETFISGTYKVDGDKLTVKLTGPDGKAIDQISRSQVLERKQEQLARELEHEPEREPPGVVKDAGEHQIGPAHDGVDWEAIEQAFEKNIQFALDQARSADYPNDPESHLGYVVPDFELTQNSVRCSEAHERKPRTTSR